MKVAVLGCGPAGLLAAWASLKNDPTELVIYSKDRKKSEIVGAQYLHMPIPGITSTTPDFMIRYAKIGSRAGYCSKVYGQTDHESSWDRWEGVKPAWRLRSAYENLWDYLECFIVDRDVNQDLVQTLVRKYDVVFSTIPALSLCKGGHNFSHEAVVIGQGLEYVVEPNTIVYNGILVMPWHRASNIEGEIDFEFRSHSDVRTDHLINRKVVLKPQHTNCDCYPKVIRLGRYGKWKRDILVSDAYAEAGEWV